MEGWSNWPGSNKEHILIYASVQWADLQGDRVTRQWIIT